MQERSSALPEIWATAGEGDASYGTLALGSAESWEADIPAWKSTTAGGDSRKQTAETLKGIQVPLQQKGNKSEEYILLPLIQPHFYPWPGGRSHTRVNAGQVPIT